MLFKQLFARKTLETLQAEAAGENRLRRVLGPVALTSLGIGAIIGSGIFVMTGRVAAVDAGPAVMLSYVVAGIGCVFAAFCYSEFASMAPVAGSAYTYAYATLGEVFAWIIGWDLVLEYAMACAVVAAGWTHYLSEFLLVLFGVRIPEVIASDPFSHSGAWFNLPAVFIVLACTVILVIGIRESATTNAVLVMVKVGVVLFVIVVGVFYINPDNWKAIPPSERVTAEEEKVIPDLAEEVVKKSGGDKLPADARDRKVALLTLEAKLAYKADQKWTQTEDLRKRGRVEEARAAVRNTLVQTAISHLEGLKLEGTGEEQKNIVSDRTWLLVDALGGITAQLRRDGVLTAADARTALTEAVEKYTTDYRRKRPPGLGSLFRTEAFPNYFMTVRDAQTWRDRAQQVAGQNKPPADWDQVRSVLKQVPGKVPGALTEKWGLLGEIGINRKLETIDNSVRSPFAPYGLSGIIFGASLVFFAYIGFDAISTHSEEAVKPQRDVPIGILASLAICTVLYILVSAVITGMERYPDINRNAAVSAAFTRKAEAEGNSLLLNLASLLISTGALAGLTSVLLITFLSQARIFLAMARDGLMPPRVFGAIHERFRTPHISTMLTGGIIAVVAALTPIEDLEQMVNIGTLMAFVIVCAAVLLLRIRHPEAQRPFRTPFLFVMAPLGIFVNLLMMLFLPPITWLRLVVWLAIGLVIYFSYGARHSTVGKQLEYQRTTAGVGNGNGGG